MGDIEVMRSKIEKDLQAFINGRISRRTLMSRAATVGAVSALPLGVLSGEAKAAGPKKGGTFRMATSQGSTTDLLDTTKLTSGFTQMLFFTHMSQLTEIGVDGDVHPVLAESFETNDDATEWVFNLRKGVEFHNGKTMDADDVIMSIARHQGEDSESPTKNIAEEIQEMRKDGNNRVIFKLKSGNVDFPFSMSASTFGVHPVINGEVDVSGIGTGAYKLTEFDPGIGAKLEKHRNYFFEDRGHFDSVDVTVVHDATARQSALQTGEVDFIGGVKPQLADLMAKLPGVKVAEVTGMQHYLYAMNTTVAPFDNNHVRLALKYAMDREAILKIVLQGHGSLGNDNPISPNDRFFADDIPQRPYDPEKAKFHLKKAGLSNLDVELSATNGLFEGALDSAVLYKEHARAAGINIIPKNVPSDGYWSDVWMKHPWSASYWSGRPTADWMLSQGYSEESSWNETYWKHDRFNKVLKEARAEQDTAKRKEMYNELQHLIHNDGGALVFLYANHISAFSEKVAHPDKIAGNWELDGYKIMERWWFA